MGEAANGFALHKPRTRVRLVGERNGPMTAFWNHVKRVFRGKEKLWLVVLFWVIPWNSIWVSRIAFGLFKYQERLSKDVVFYIFLIYIHQFQILLFSLTI